MANAATVGLCTGFTYADGGIYCRDNGDGACLGDLGDFPAKTSFPWHIDWADDMSLFLLERTGSREYTRYKDKLYIDASPGAVVPLRYTADNSTLTGGETSWAWTGAYGIIMWTPTGNIRDATPNGSGSIIGSGFELVEVKGYPGLRQAYWNQQKFDDMLVGKYTGGFLTMCYGDYSPIITEGNRPWDP
ncbi:hypothetical protein AJ80_02218 [Polytolypa hystricis UAMH7299]|uniref:Uncharacterized protein n=1 Tax=Polytolypa hystricis (strain UAMH7299) TaxID=1447883 RepID=A0A2B7YSC3_POLH7|nr:hypothetical protein AJ80_02218 [Polytolypa hystricis UAMH7299]